MKTFRARQVAELAPGERADMRHVTQTLDRLVVRALLFVLRGAHVLHDDAPAPAQHAPHLPQDRAGVGEMMEAIATDRQVERFVLEGQPPDIALHVSPPARHGLADHLPGQVDAGDA